MQPSRSTLWKTALAAIGLLAYGSAFALGQPIARYPVATQFNEQPTYGWSRVNDATWYYLYVSGPGGVQTEWVTAANAGLCQITAVSTCEFTPNFALLPPGGHTWWVLPWNATEGYGPWSAGSYFNKEEILTLYPSGADSGASRTSRNTGGVRDENSSLNLNWGVVSGASWYNLYVQDSTGVRHNQWHEAANVCGAICGFDPTPSGGYSTSGEVTWWVQPYKDDASYGSNGYGQWSQPDFFRYRTSSTFMIVQPKMTSPNSYQMSGVGSYTFEWTCPGVGCSVDEYWIDVGSTRGGTDIASRSVGTDTSELVTGLHPDAYNYVRLWYLRDSIWRHSDWRWYYNDTANSPPDETAPPVPIGAAPNDANGTPPADPPPPPGT